MDLFKKGATMNSSVVRANFASIGAKPTGIGSITHANRREPRIPLGGDVLGNEVTRAPVSGYLPNIRVAA